MDSRPRTRSRPSTIRTCGAVTPWPPCRHAPGAAWGKITLLPLPVRYR